MWPALAAIGIFALIVSAYLLGRHMAGRRQVYHMLANLRPQLTAGLEPRLVARPVDSQLAATFDRDHLVFVANFVDPEWHREMQAEALATVDKSERSFIPRHKKGGTLAYERVHFFAPRCLAFYHSPRVMQFIESVVGQKVYPTGDHDQSSCSVLVYNEPGDHINWHFDHNFYNGRHFTVLLSLYNRARSGGVSSSKLYRKSPTGEDVVVDTAENNLVLFEGCRCRHRATQTAEGDVRILLSMTYATDPGIVWAKEAVRKVKDSAYYGVRALYD